jgi:hypothetical protein
LLRIRIARITTISAECERVNHDKGKYGCDDENNRMPVTRGNSYEQEHDNEHRRTNSRDATDEIRAFSAIDTHQGFPSLISQRSTVWLADAALGGTNRV